MEQPSVNTPRVATAPDAATVARLLDTFNREYDTPTPGTAVLATRLGRLLAGADVIALLTGDPAVVVALLTLRPNVWHEGPVAMPTSSTSRRSCADEDSAPRCSRPPRP